MKAESDHCCARSKQLAIMVVALFTLTGCGSRSKVERLAIHGLVVIDGELVQQGSISFLPTKGTSGPAANTSINSGQYRFSTRTGPVVGTHEVLISIAPPDPKSVKMGEPVERLPKEKKLEATIRKGKSEVNFEF